MNVMKYAYVVIGTLCVWIFTVLVIDLNDLLDLPMPLYALVLAVMITGAHVFGVRRFGKPGDSFEGSTYLKVAITTIVSLVFAIGLGLGVTALINKEYRAEISAPFVTCERDGSNITTTPVNKELVTTKGTISVYQVISNVPQSSEHPQPYTYECQKATLVEIGVAGAKTGKASFEVSDLELKVTGVSRYVDADELNSGSEFKSYAKTKGIEGLSRTSLRESGSGRGWIEFAMPENVNGSIESLIYDRFKENKTLELGS